MSAVSEASASASTPTTAGSALGREFIEALVRDDFDAMRSLLHPDVHFRGLSPHKFLKASPSDPVGGVLRAFRLSFYEGEGDFADHPEELLSCAAKPFGYGGRYKLSYRIRSKTARWRRRSGTMAWRTFPTTPTGSWSRRPTTTWSTAGSAG